MAKQGKDGQWYEKGADGKWARVSPAQAKITNTEPSAPRSVVAETSLPDAMIRGYAKGGTFGLSDRLGAAGQAGLQAMTGEAKDENGQPMPSGQVYDEALKGERYEDDKARKDHGFGFGAAEMLGGAATAGGIGKIAKAIKGAPAVSEAAATLGQRFMSGAKAAAPLGAAAGAGYSRGDLTTGKGLAETGLNTLAGGALGGVLGGVGSVSPLALSGIMGTGAAFGDHVGMTPEERALLGVGAVGVAAPTLMNKGLNYVGNKAGNVARAAEGQVAENLAAQDAGALSKATKRFDVTAAADPTMNAFNSESKELNKALGRSGKEKFKKFESLVSDLESGRQQAEKGVAGANAEHQNLMSEAADLEAKIPQRVQSKEASEFGALLNRISTLKGSGKQVPPELEAFVEQQLSRYEQNTPGFLAEYLKSKDSGRLAEGYKQELLDQVARMRTKAEALKSAVPQAVTPEQAAAPPKQYVTPEERRQLAKSAGIEIPSIAEVDPNSQYAEWQKVETGPERARQAALERLLGLSKPLEGEKSDFLSMFSESNKKDVAEGLGLNTVFKEAEKPKGPSIGAFDKTVAGKGQNGPAVDTDAIDPNLLKLARLGELVPAEVEYQGGLNPRIQHEISKQGPSAAKAALKGALSLTGGVPMGAAGLALGGPGGLATGLGGGAIKGVAQAAAKDPALRAYVFQAAEKALKFSPEVQAKYGPSVMHAIAQGDLNLVLGFLQTQTSGQK